MFYVSKSPVFLCAGITLSPVDSERRAQAELRLIM